MKLHYTWNCPWCPAVLESRRLFQKHKKEQHNGNRKNPVWSLGGNCQYCGNEFKYKHTLTLHEKHCHLNPNRVPGKSNKKTIEQKQHLIEIALEGYRNGTWKGWMNCHSSDKSYPEKFFTKVIENEFENKNYEYNYSFFQYRLDFAWVLQKKCIEIDGQQHQNDPKQAESDKRKDSKLLENGWQVLRIKWTDMFNNPKEWIQIAKDFINKQ